MTTSSQASSPHNSFTRFPWRAAESDHDPDAHEEVLRAELRELSLQEIISFEVAFRRYLNEAYTWDLWGAAALADPDSLAQLNIRPGPDGVCEFEAIYYVAGQIFKEKGGQGDVRDYSEPEAGLGGPGPSGEPFEDDEEHLARRYPKLWRRFGAKPLG